MGANTQTKQPLKPQFFTKGQFRTLEKFADVFIEGENEAITPREIAINLDSFLFKMPSKRKGSIRLLFIIIEYVFPLLSFRLLPFSRLNTKARKKIILRKLERTKRGTILRSLSKIKLLFFFGYYGDPRVNEKVNFVPVKKRKKYKPEDFEILNYRKLPIETPTEDTLKTQVCVIGSGAGGAVVAYNAAAAGNDVVLLEEGSYVTAKEMNHDLREMIPKLYKEGGAQTTVDSLMPIIQGKCLGGTTVINNAICLRINNPGMSPNGHDLLAVWKKLGVNIDVNKLNEAYDRVEKKINVGKISEETGGEGGRVLLDGIKKLQSSGELDKKYKSDYFKKNYKESLGCGFCNWGCPYGRKMSMLETYIPGAIDNGARVVTDCKVVKIERHGNKVTGVKCELKGGRKLFVRADKVVVSCGAIGSSVLLMESGIGGSRVGKNFSFNAFTNMNGRFERVINSYDGAQMASYMDGGNFILETIFNPPMLQSGLIPGWFNTHFERMRAYDRLASIGIVVGTENNGRVKRIKFLRDMLGPVIYTMTDKDFKDLKDGMVLATQVFFAAGAKAVYPNSLVDIEMKADEFDSHDKIERLINSKIKKPNDVIHGSSHPQGGNAMSDSKKKGVVNNQFKVHGYENLYVCDASVFPTTITVNPQLTIMAMAEYLSNQQGWV